MFILFVAHQSIASNKNLSINSAHIPFTMYIGNVAHISANKKHNAKSNAIIFSIFFFPSDLILYLLRDNSYLLNISLVPNVTL